MNNATEMSVLLVNCQYCKTCRFEYCFVDFFYNSDIWSVKLEALHSTDRVLLNTPAMKRFQAVSSIKVYIAHISYFLQELLFSYCHEIGFYYSVQCLKLGFKLINKCIINALLYNAEVFQVNDLTISLSVFK